MGCDFYSAENYEIHFNESNDEFRCLCTFPFNDRDEIDYERIISLALLGASVVLLHQGDIRDNISVPNDLPKWIVKEISEKIRMITNVK